MTKITLKSLFLIISIMGIGCEGKYISDKEIMNWAIKKLLESVFN